MRIAANYLSVGQIYLDDNPLLRQPLKLDHTKPRLLGHWGTELDVNRSTALNLGRRQLQLIEEIDEALLRIEDGTYGECARCGKPIDEQRLKAMPSAKYDAECQAAVELSQGIEGMPTL